MDLSFPNRAIRDWGLGAGPGSITALAGEAVRKPRYRRGILDREGESIVKKGNRLPHVQARPPPALC